MAKTTARATRTTAEPGYRRVLAYARVSSEGQRDGTSLDSQEERFKSYCSSRGYPAPIVYPEVESASEKKIERRVKLAALIADAQSGDLILAMYVDRWSRDTVFAVQSIRALVKRGVSWQSVSEGIDAATPEGDAQLGFLAVMADQWLRRHTERTVGARKRLQDMGLYAHAALPFGYVRADRRLAIEPIEAEIVRELYHRCTGGESLNAIRRTMRMIHPGRAWDKKTTHTILTSRVYLGELTSTDGTQIKDCHPPIVTLDQWARAQKALASRRASGRLPNGVSTTASWLLRGIASCASCGHKMGPSLGTKRKNGDRPIYYHCASHAHRSGCVESGSCPVRTTDDEAAHLLLARLSELRHELAKPRKVLSVARVTDWSDERAKIQRRRARLIELVESGIAKLAEVKSRFAELDRELETIAAEESQEQRLIALQASEFRQQLLSLVEVIEGAFSLMTTDERRNALTLCAERISLKKGDPVRITWRSVEEMSL